MGKNYFDAQFFTDFTKGGSGLFAIKLFLYGGFTVGFVAAFPIGYKIQLPARTMKKASKWEMILEDISPSEQPLLLLEVSQMMKQFQTLENQIRGYFTQVALAALRTKNANAIPLHTWYENIRRRKGWKVARVALSRKMAAITYGVLKHRQPYNPSLVTWEEKRA